MLCRWQNETLPMRAPCQTGEAEVKGNMMRNAGENDPEGRKFMGARNPVRSPCWDSDAWGRLCIGSLMLSLRAPALGDTC